LPAAATDDWLAPGLVVRVVHRTVGGGAYFKAKGVVVKVVDTYGAHVRLLEGGAVLSLDVADLETTVPGVGGSVRILYGVHRGALGRVRALDSAECSAEVELLGEGAGGRVVRGLDYEHVCRVEGV
jgi:DNA/RNA-binding protein KIN17